MPIPLHQGCGDQRWRVSKPVPWARQRGVYRLSSPADRRAASEDLSQKQAPAHLLRVLPGQGARETGLMRWLASPAAVPDRSKGWKQPSSQPRGLTARGARCRVRKSERSGPSQMWVITMAPLPMGGCRRASAAARGLCQLVAKAESSPSCEQRLQTGRCAQ